MAWIDQFTQPVATFPETGMNTTTNYQTQIGTLSPSDQQSRQPPLPSGWTRSPGPAGSEGSGSYASFNGVGYRWDGTNWIPYVNSQGAIQNGQPVGPNGQPVATSGGYPGGSIPQTAPQGGQTSADYQRQFMQIMQGLPATPENLAAKEAELNAIGLKVHRNAAGVPGKVTLPNGYNVDVIANAGSGGGGSWQWLDGPTHGIPTPGGAGPINNAIAGSLGGMFNGGDQMAVLASTPGYQWALNEGLNAQQRGAAAKGTLLTGGFQKDLAKYLSGAIAMPVYQQRFNNLFSVAGLGENAAALTGNAASNYANSATNTLTGIGNAQAAGQVGSANAWSNALNGIGQNVLGGVYASQSGYTPTFSNGANPYPVPPVQNLPGY